MGNLSRSAYSNIKMFRRLDLQICAFVLGDRNTINFNRLRPTHLGVLTTTHSPYVHEKHCWNSSFWMLLDERLMWNNEKKGMVFAPLQKNSLVGSPRCGHGNVQPRSFLAPGACHTQCCAGLGVSKQMLALPYCSVPTCYGFLWQGLEKSQELSIICCIVVC